MTQYLALDDVCQSALAHRETVEATYDLARVCLERRVPGDFVECGVFAGAQCAAMAKAMLDWGTITGKRVHLFDSFQGLPPARECDEEIFAKHGARLSGEAVCSLEQVQANMRRWGIPDELLVYHKGWFCDTIPRAYADIKAIALLRLDADLYESTRDAMALYPLVSRGGWVIVDDWNLTGTRKAVDEIVVPAPIYWRVPTK